MTDTDKLAKIAAQRDAYQSIAKRHCDTISNIADTLEDEGDRVYLGSSNDADDLREVAQAMQNVGWDRHLGNDQDWPKRVRDLTDEVAKCHANINTKADFIDATINQLAGADERIAALRKRVEAAEELARRVYLEHSGVPMRATYVMDALAAFNATAMKCATCEGTGNVSTTDVDSEDNHIEAACPSCSPVQL